jgi:hypothetical protein
MFMEIHASDFLPFRRLGQDLSRRCRRMASSSRRSVAISCRTELHWNLLQDSVSVEPTPANGGCLAWVSYRIGMPLGGDTQLMACRDSSWWIPGKRIARSRG